MATKAPKKAAPSKRQLLTTEQTAAIVERAVTIRAPAIKAHMTSAVDRFREDTNRMAADYDTYTEQLNDLQDAIKIKEDELAKLNESKEMMLSLDDLRQRREELESEMLARREEMKQDRDREQAEYTYTLSRQRIIDTNNYNDARAKQDAAFNNRCESIRASLDKEAAELNEKDIEFERLQKLEAELPDTIKKAEAKQEAIIKAVLTKDHAHEMAILRSEMTAAAMLAKSQIEALQASLSDRFNAINKLNEQLSAANERMAKMAGDVAASQSGREALEAVQQTAASMTPQSKSSGR